MCLSVQNWFNSPISWQEEKRAVLVVSAVVAAILAFGAFCYTYQGGRFADIPGYNQYYGIACWSLGGAIALGTIISYIAKSILNAKRVDAVFNQPRKLKIPALAALTLGKACEKNNNFRKLIKAIPIENFKLLTEEEYSKRHFIGLIEYTYRLRGYYKYHGIDPKDLLAVFEDKKSSFVAGRQSTGDWFIAARIEWRKPTGEILDGVCVLNHTSADDGHWYGNIHFFNYNENDHLAESFGKKSFFINFVLPEMNFSWGSQMLSVSATRVVQESLWLQKILEGQAPGMINPPKTEEKPEELGTIHLWKPASKT